MKHWSKRIWTGLVSVSLCLALLAGMTPAGAITVEQMRELLEERYVDEVPAAALEQDTVEATVAALGDPYSWYLTAEELELYMDTDVDEKVVGIGVGVRLSEDGLEVLYTEAGSPAAEAGLEAGDVLVKVDGVALEGMTLDEAAALIRGGGGDPCGPDLPPGRPAQKHTGGTSAGGGRRHPGRAAGGRHRVHTMRRIRQ